MKTGEITVKMFIFLLLAEPVSFYNFQIPTKYVCNISYFYVNITACNAANRK
jgi:hypothetical protein